MLEIIFLIVLSLYFFISVFLVDGVSKKFLKIPDNLVKTITVIVCARDEEKNILACLQSLNNLNYPPNKLEIIIADDGSTDMTGKIIDDYIRGKNNFKKIAVVQNVGKLFGKTNALAQAIKKASGEIILTTDADCIVPPNWAKTLALYYTENVGAVCGFTIPYARNFFEGMQAVDLCYLLTVAAGTTNFEKPISCLGNNMSFIKSAYEAIGGYENIPISVTEDFALLNAISKLGKYQILFPLEKDLMVSTKACDNFKSLISQKKRWAVGGLNAPLYGIFILLVAILTNLFVFITPLFFNDVWLYLLVFKIAIDFLVVYPVHKRLEISKNLKYFFGFQIYYTLYVLIIPLILLFNRKVIWKGREF